MNGVTQWMVERWVMSGDLPDGVELDTPYPAVGDGAPDEVTFGYALGHRVAYLQRDPGLDPDDT